MKRSATRLFSWTWTSTALTCAVLLVASAQGAHAGTNVWTSHGPYEVFVLALAIDPSTPSTLYAGTIGGVGVFQSTNSGGSWSAVNTGLGGFTVYALAIDPTTPSTLYAGTNNGVFDIEQVSSGPTPTPTAAPCVGDCNGDLTASVQLQASGTGSGTVVSGDDRATITITAKANIASNYVGVYLGVLNITAGPDSSNNLSIDLFVANDGTAAGATSDPAGDDVGFQGTVNFTSGALTLAVNYSESSPGMTGNLTGTVATGSFDLFNGDTGTYSFSKVAP